MKKATYITLATILGVLLSYVMHSALEIWYLRILTAHNYTITWYQHFGVGSCALPPLVQYGLLLVGLVGGWLLGHMWWKIVYIDHRHWRQRAHRDSENA